MKHCFSAPRSPLKTAEVVEKKKVGRRGKRVKGKVRGPYCKKQLQMEHEPALPEPATEGCTKVESEIKSENSFAPSSSVSLTTEGMNLIIL